MSSPSDVQQKINAKLEKIINMNQFNIKEVSNKVTNTFGLKCKKCGSSEIYETSKQTRSSDEATTKFYECLHCKHKWAVY